MPELDFKIAKAQPVPYAVSPLLSFTLDISTADPRPIHAVALRAQVWIEPARRKYQDSEKARLLDLFGEPARWGQTLKNMIWAHAGIVVPALEGSTSVELPVPCTFDFNVAATKFFNALEGDEVPLRFLFSGSIFHATEDHAMQVAQISWEKEAVFRLPVAVWKAMMEMYYPNTAWLCLRKDAFDLLYQFKSSRGLPTWETAIEKLVAEAGEQVTP